MRVLVLTKRQYTGKDLLDDRYGRLYEIPAAMARSGHAVVGAALSYRRRTVKRIDDPSGLTWYSVDALPTGAWRYPGRLRAIIRELRPDVIWAASDAFHAIFAAALSRLTGIPLVIDLYDNFESFSATGLPGLRSLFRAACRTADALTVVSHTLRDYVVGTYGITSPVVVVGNGVDPRLFSPRDRELARSRLGLPVDSLLCGTAGAITADRDIASMFNAFLSLVKSNRRCRLVFAGPRDRTPDHYRHSGIIDLGILPFDRIPDFYAALDVAVVCNRDSDFGRYCFPLKLFEIIACGRPLVAAAVGDLAAVLAAYPESLYRPGDPQDLARRLAEQLVNPRLISGLTIPTWDQLGTLVETTLAQVVD